MEKYYVLSTTITSSGAEDRKFNPYDAYDTALRKYHEAFGNVGAGPTQICASLLDKFLNVVKHEVWVVEEEIDPEESEE